MSEPETNKSKKIVEAEIRFGEFGYHEFEDRNIKIPFFKDKYFHSYKIQPSLSVHCDGLVSKGTYLAIGHNIIIESSLEDVQFTLKCERVEESGGLVVRVYINFVPLSHAFINYREYVFYVTEGAMLNIVVDLKTEGESVSVDVKYKSS